MKTKALIFLLLLQLSNFSYAKNSHQIQLANLYNKTIKIDEYLVSEKLDGVRAYWNGKELISKQGNVINAPKCFTKNLPSQHLEGELWIARNSFEKVAAIVQKENSTCDDWQDIKLMLFDLPQLNVPFSQRFIEMQKIVKDVNYNNLQVIEQFSVASHQALEQKLKEIVKQGGEGLMLHKANSFYQATRNDNVLKYKTYEDEEAKVIAHIAGKGKYDKMMGAILVENKDGIRFKIGGGFSDQYRKNPPPIGSIITYKFYGKTKNNKPKFASFLRVSDIQKNESNK